MENKENEYQAVSFYTLRKIIGTLGILLPTSLLVYTLLHSDCNIVLNSISAYFHSRAGHLFCAIAFFIGIVMFNSVKYQEDKWYYRIAGSLAVIIAFVPNLQEQDLGACFIRQNDSVILDKIHLGAAISFFLLLAYFCYFRFTKFAEPTPEKPNVKKPSVEKLRRNRIYKWCGVLMIVTMVLILVAWKLEPRFDAYRPLFVGETIMLIIFSYAWLVKGQLWFKNSTEEKEESNSKECPES